MANQLKASYIVTVEETKVLLHECFNSNFYLGDALELVTQEYAAELLDQTDEILT